MEITDDTIKQLTEINIHVFIKYYGIKNEVGNEIDFHEHLFLFDVYEDFSPKMVLMKAAQVGATTAEVVKKMWGVKTKHLDGIYCLPTAADVNTLVSGKVNRIISHNPIFQEWVKDKDSIEQKQVGDNFIYFRGTWTEKAAIMVTSDWNSYDEVDSCKPDVVEQYSTRQQHSKHKIEHYFSHPSAQGSGVDRYWAKSDQKHWFNTCPHCKKKQYLSWPDSIDRQRKIFVCKSCGGEIDKESRRVGEWIPKFKNREFSGYWIPLLICPWVSAAEIIGYHEDKSEEYFYNKVLGLPYVGGGNKLTKAILMKNLTQEDILPGKDDRIVIGIDTGKHIHWVAGTEKGLFAYGEDSSYDEIRNMLNRWPRSIVVVDQGGDLIGSRKLREDYPGRVYLCSYGADRKTMELVRWGAKDENGSVIVDRNRMIQLIVDEFTDSRIPIFGTENDWFDYFLHWNNLTRIKEENDQGMIRKIWIRNGDDHWAHATTYWRSGMSRFSTGGYVERVNSKKIDGAKGVTINPDRTIDVNEEDFWPRQEHDWRSN
jgi:hypothetical protein